MNQEHLELLRSDGWRELLRDLILPFAFDGADVRTLLGEEVLEIGPGPGLTTDLLSPLLPAMTAIELDPALAQELADRVGAEVTVVEGDATQMPFESGRFTGVVSFTMLHHVPTLELQDRLFAEACRVLRPGGTLVVSDSVASDELAALHEGDIYNPASPQDLVSRLRSAGFGRVDVRSNDFGWAVHASR